MWQLILVSITVRHRQSPLFYLVFKSFIGADTKWYEIGGEAEFHVCVYYGIIIKCYQLSSCVCMRVCLCVRLLLLHVSNLAYELIGTSVWGSKFATNTTKLLMIYYILLNARCIPRRWRLITYIVLYMLYYYFFRFAINWCCSSYMGQKVTKCIGLLLD